MATNGLCYAESPRASRDSFADTKSFAGEGVGRALS